MTPAARGSELKLAHAQDHLQEISDLVYRWVEACLETLREEPDPNEAGYFCAWIDAPEIDTKRLSLSSSGTACKRSARPSITSRSNSRRRSLSR